MSIEETDMIHVQIMNALYHPTILRTGWLDDGTHENKNTRKHDGNQLWLAIKNFPTKPIHWTMGFNYTICPLISHLSCPSAQSVSQSYIKVLTPLLALGWFTTLQGGIQSISFFFIHVYPSIDRSIDLYSYQKRIQHSGLTLWLFNSAMENGPFIDGLPINSMVIFHGYVK